MRARSKSAVFISSVVLIFGLTTISRAQRSSTDERRCVQDVLACRIIAEQGDAKAENALGIVYSKGQGVPQDYTEALRWYGKAADQGYAKAQYNLGNMYYYGRGVPQDRGEAERWYQKAAAQGDEYAQRALGLRWTLTRWSALTLGLAFLVSLWLLKDAVLPQGNPRHHQSRSLTLGGISGLVYIGLSLYGHFTVFTVAVAANAFHFLNNFVAGTTFAMLISAFAPKKAKVVMAVSIVLLVVSDFVVVSRHELARFVMSVRGFSSINGLLIGLTVSLAMFLWLQPKSRAQVGRVLPGLLP